MLPSHCIHLCSVLDLQLIWSSCCHRETCQGHLPLLFSFSFLLPVWSLWQSSPCWAYYYYYINATNSRVERALVNVMHASLLTCNYIYIIIYIYILYIYLSVDIYDAGFAQLYNIIACPYVCALPYIISLTYRCIVVSVQSKKRCHEDALNITGYNVEQLAA